MPNILKTLADNPALLKATKECVLKYFSLEKMGTEVDNEVLGQYVRARVEGVELIERAFKEIEGLQSYSPSKEKINPAV